MEFKRDQFFFHYTTREAAFEHILPTGRLRFSRYEHMRDPLENRAWLIAAGGWGDKTPAQEEEEAAGFFTFNRMADAVRRESRLLSLSVDSPEDLEEPDPFFRGWARARMWEQYAETHKGACLVFDREALGVAVDTEIDHLKLPKANRGLVEYESGRSDTPMLDFDRLRGENPESYVAQYVAEHFRTLFFMKTLDWEAEHEFRFSIIGPLGDPEPFEVFMEKALVAVIVGELFPRWQIPGALEACHVAGAQPLRIAWDVGAPRLAPLMANRDTASAVERPKYP
jgi:hypothetical protein